MVYCGFKRVDFSGEKQEIHGYSFYYEVEHTAPDVGFHTEKDFVSDALPGVSDYLKEAVRTHEDVRVERNRYGKVIAIF